ncbi:MAG: PaaI family thioesterase [Eubacteriales bacterium]|nr:PaaI family thioesterase [Eubacteriales bacterium]
MKTLDEIRAYFAMDRYATEATGLEILEAGDGYAKIGLTLQDRHKNARGQVMGAVYFTMADFAFAVALNTLEGKEGVTLESNIRFLSTPKSDRLYAETNLVKNGRTVIFYEITVTDDTGRRLAVITSTGFNVAGR